MVNCIISPVFPCNRTESFKVGRFGRVRGDRRATFLSVVGFTGAADVRARGLDLRPMALPLRTLDDPEWPSDERDLPPFQPRRDPVRGRVRRGVCPICAQQDRGYERLIPSLDLGASDLRIC